MYSCILIALQLKKIYQKRGTKQFMQSFSEYFIYTSNVLSASGEGPVKTFHSAALTCLYLIIHSVCDEIIIRIRSDMFDQLVFSISFYSTNHILTLNKRVTHQLTCFLSAVCFQYVLNIVVLNSVQIFQKAAICYNSFLNVFGVTWILLKSKFIQYSLKIYK